MGCGAARLGRALCRSQPARYRLSALGPVPCPGRLERAIRLSADAGLPHDPFRAPAGGRRLVDAAAIGEGATRRLARERATALYAARLLMSPSSSGPQNGRAECRAEGSRYV